MLWQEFDELVNIFKSWDILSFEGLCRHGNVGGSIPVSGINHVEGALPGQGGEGVVSDFSHQLSTML